MATSPLETRQSGPDEALPAAETLAEDPSQGFSISAVPLSGPGVAVVATQGESHDEKATTFDAGTPMPPTEDVSPEDSGIDPIVQADADGVISIRDKPPIKQHALITTSPSILTATDDTDENNVPPRDMMFQVLLNRFVIKSFYFLLHYTYLVQSIIVRLQSNNNKNNMHPDWMRTIVHSGTIDRIKIAQAPSYTVSNTIQTKMQQKTFTWSCFRIYYFQLGHIKIVLARLFLTCHSLHTPIFTEWCHSQTWTSYWNWLSERRIAVVHGFGAEDRSTKCRVIIARFRVRYLVSICSLLRKPCAIDSGNISCITLQQNHQGTSTSFVSWAVRPLVSHHFLVDSQTNHLLFRTTSSTVSKWLNGRSIFKWRVFVDASA